MAGTTNFLQFNNPAINQETDAQYAADPIRATGAPVDSPCPSPFFNKLNYQTTTFVAAFCGMLANKNISTSDADILVLEAVLANILTSGDVPSGLQAIAYSPTPSLNVGNSNGFFMSLAGNSAIQSVGGFPEGRLVTFLYQQDGVGGRTVTFPGNMFGAVSPDTQATVLSAQSFIAHSGSLFATGPLESHTGNLRNAAGIFGSLVQVSGGGSFGGALSAASAAIVGAFSTASATISGALSAASATISGLLNVGSFQIGGGAPNGQVLTGNGSTYVPQVIPNSTSVTSDVTGARSFGTVFNNGSGKPMTVNGYGMTSGSSVGSVEAIVDGISVWANTVASTVTNGTCGFSFPVPPGKNYQILANSRTNGQGNAVVSVGKWTETLTS